MGTIHLRRRQIFTIFDPYPPTIGIPAKCLWRRFLILMYCDLSTIETCWRLGWSQNCRRLNEFTGKLQSKIALAYCLPKNFDHRIKNQKFCRFMKLSDEPIRFTTSGKCRSQCKALWKTRLFLRYLRPLSLYFWIQDLKGCVVKR